MGKLLSSTNVLILTHLNWSAMPTSKPRKNSRTWQVLWIFVVVHLWLANVAVALQQVRHNQMWSFADRQNKLFGEMRKRPSYRSDNIRRQMVLTTPESIIEQASTQSLLDDLIDESVRTSARRPIMMQFDPSSGWIWKRWKGTIFSETWDSCVTKMLYASIVFLICKTYPGIKEALSGFNTLWGQLLSVTTFTLTFFVNQSYALWRKCYQLSRRLQGRLHDLDLALAAHAARKPPTNPNELSTYTPAARQLLELVSRYVRLFNLLTYASFTRSHRPILTPRGMRRLVERGLMTPGEREVLIDAQVPATQRHNAVLLWILRVFVEGREAGHFLGGAGFEEQFIEKVLVCRAQYGGIGDELQGRMPLAYAHIVQVLVDVVLWMYPFMAFSSGMSGFLTVLGTGLLTVSYQGLFDLAKQFLDPYDNESYGKGEDPLVVDTLIAETNAGSVRWMYSLEEMPVSPQKIKDGELSEYLLPIRGYSVAELGQMEEERTQKERELKEKREREDFERLRLEKEEASIRDAAAAMIPALFDESDGAISNVTYKIAAESQESTHLPFNTSDAFVTMTDAEGVSRLIDELSVINGAVPVALVPDPAMLSVLSPSASHGAKLDSFASAEAESGRTRCLDSDDGHFVDDSMLAEVAQDKNVREDNYRHTFETFDPYHDLPWHDNVGPDGQEVRLSQMLANEVFQEELELQTERLETPVRTYAEFARRKAEIENSLQGELDETQQVLMASPGAESGEAFVRGPGTMPKFDQTQLNGISQLWGIQPDDLPQSTEYRETSVTPTSFDEISQLWGGNPASSVNMMPTPTIDESFSAIGQLWGEDLKDSVGSDPKFRESSEDSDDASSRGEQSSDLAELRLSQRLADEVWAEELESGPMKPPDFEDYERQIAALLEAEERERLETEAIMNAPPGADSLEVIDKEADRKVESGNRKADDDLSVLEMDPPANATTIMLAPLLHPKNPDNLISKFDDQTYAVNASGLDISDEIENSEGTDDLGGDVMNTTSTG